MHLMSLVVSLSLSAAAPVFPGAELGGQITVENLSQPRPAPVPVSVNLYAGDRLVATSLADFQGRYMLAAPPGDYWLQIVVGGVETRVERVRLAPGSSRHDWATELWVPGQTLAILQPGVLAGVNAALARGGT